MTKVSICLYIVPVLLVYVHGRVSISTSLPSSVRCEDPDPPSHGSVNQLFYPVQKAHYVCNEGFYIVGSSKQVCNELGQWNPSAPPMCNISKAAVQPIKKMKDWITDETEFSCSVSSLDGLIALENGMDVGFPGSTAILYCGNNRSIKIVCSLNGKWVSADRYGSIPSCRLNCNSPPEIPHALFYLTHNPATEGTRAVYRCNQGYVIVVDEQNKSGSLTCSNNNWLGSPPSCVERCQPPDEISHGYSHVVSSDSYIQYFSSNFPIGTLIEYRCNSGYRVLGTAVIECLSDHKWSHFHPVCIKSNAESQYCRTLSKLANGHCWCGDLEDMDFSSYCEPFYEGMKIYCSCDKGYRMKGMGQLSCSHQVWDYPVPTCQPDYTGPVVPADDVAAEDSNSESSHGISPLGIVIATACSVLGVLLLVMVVMVFRRRKPRPISLTSSQAPPPYSRVHSNSVDEHDRVLLIGYDGSHPPALPSYEEAVTENTTSGHHHRRQRCSSGGQHEYRPLPSIPSNLRNTFHQTSPDNNNRHSTLTTSTVTRDGISDVFGSIDTVNVSISDASTSVTVETYDSGSSHPSNMSGRGTAGSLGSLSGSAITEDVPLLDNGNQDEDGESSEGNFDEAEEVKEN